LKISLNWLKDYINLDAISVDEIVNKLTISGLEVEEVEYQAKVFDNFIVGFVKERIKHPNADKLSLCKIFDGKEDIKVVCGAPNVEEGQKIPFAKVGAVIPNGGFKIAAVKIRGEESFGMICSEKELGLSDDHSGIMVLNSSFEAGMPLADALNLNDVIIDIAITANRPDALSHIGIARELSSIFNIKMNYPEIQLKRSKLKSEDLAEVEVKDAIGCPRYVAKVVNNVEIKESPEWMKTRLKNIGMRPINNVVDITNYVMQEVGQPLHAFDLNTVRGKKIIVRRAGDNEEFVTLDSKQRKMVNTDLMICDAEISVGVAGVMGGENSEIKDTTKNILIESAHFNPSMIRKTARKLGLQTDASYRFERGSDPDITVWAAKRAAQLMALYAGGEVANGELDIYPVKIKKRVVTLRYSRIEKIQGYKIPKKDTVKILTNLGFEVETVDSDTYKVKVPNFRPDVEREIDLIEEIARIYGYDKVPDIDKISIVLDAKTDESAFTDKVKCAFTGMGFYEIMTNSLLEKETALKFGNAIGVLSPKSSDMSHLRPSLLPGVMYTISRNIKVKEKNLQLFEIGKVFARKEGITEENIKSFENFSEEEYLTAAISGSANSDEWYTKEEGFTLFDMKGIAEEFFAQFSLDSEIKEEYDIENQFLEDVIEYSINGVKTGIIGSVKKDMLKLFDIEQNVFLFNANIDLLKSFKTNEKKFKELLRYPKVVRDIAFVLEEKITSKEVISEIKEIGSNLLHHIKLFDIFRSESLGQGKKSLAFQLEFYDETKTLTEEEVEKEFWKIIKTVELKLNAQLRGK
jgi:phenylalanyl-tRNA synthetase beta chain